MKANSPVRTVTINCYLCNEEQYPNVLDQHLTKCTQKWRKTQETLYAKKLISEMVSDPAPPTKPVPYVHCKDVQQVTEYNQEAFEVYQKRSLFPCILCNKRLAGDKYVMLIRVCLIEQEY